MSRDARAKLEAIPWIAEATVRKLYPDRLQITVTEREAVRAVAAARARSRSSPPTAPCSSRQGRAAACVACRSWSAAAPPARRAISSPCSTRYPAIRDQVRAVDPGRRAALEPAAEERHRRAPARTADVEHALETLARLDREKSLLTRDITAVDLRLPDRVTVRLSDAAAQAREDAIKKATPKKKGGDA